MSFLGKLFGIAPTLSKDGAFIPSPLALKLATSSGTDFDGGVYQTPYREGNKRVLMVCTEQRCMTMANGKRFSTGNHPVEMGLPMLHLLAAGFAIDIVTPTGKPVAIEEWAMPRKDENVMRLYQDFASSFEMPGSLAEFARDALVDDTPYIAVFLPGGHGAMLGLPDNEDLGTVLRWAHARGLYMLAICHGPAALLAASDETSFIYSGYKIAAFPDAVDRQTPIIGYMPGHMPWKFGEKLEALGVRIINSKADGSCYVDRRLVSGASPKAANAFGRLASETLLAAIG